MIRVRHIAVSSLLLACSSVESPSTSSGEDVASDVTAVADVPGDDVAAVEDTSSGGPDGQATDTEPADTEAVDTQAPDVDPGPDTSEPALEPLPPPSPAEGRGWLLARGAVHVHSIFSHDACDGTVDEIPSNPGCLGEFRAQVCSSGLDFAFLTDHPAHMSETDDFVQLLLHDEAAGDTLVKNAAGAPVANIIHCGATIAGPARDVFLTVGFEGTHTMPVGLEAHLDPRELEHVSLLDVTTPADRQAVVDAIHAQSGVAIIAHSEKDELSASTIIGLPIDAMEQYNVHANFLTILNDEIERVFALEPFIEGALNPPDSNLALLAMLDAYPEPAIQKWYAVSAARPITGVIGADVHQNVTVEGYCTPGGKYEGLCDSLAEAYPVLVAALKKGGPLRLADEGRIDSYERVFRWLHNTVLVKERSAGAIREALKLGRNLSVFSVFGEVSGFDLHAEAGSEVVEIGGSISISKHPKLIVATPTPYPQPWADFTLEEAKLAEISTHVLGFDASGATIFDTTATGLSSTPMTITPDAPGRYHVEILVKPKHLTRALTSQAALADKSYRWVISNPIYVTP